MHRQVLRLGRRIAIAVGGGIVILAGALLAMPLVPGPGIALILLGLGILSLEFEWARVWLAHIKAKGLALKRKLAAMKRIASVFSLLGVASGAFVAVGSVMFPVLILGPTAFLMPLISGVVLMATHWLAFREILVGSGKRFGLLLSNAILLAVILGFLFAPHGPTGDHSPSLRMVLLAAFLLLPLISNVIYLSIQGRSPDGQAFGS